MVVQEKILFETPNFEDVVNKVIRDFHEPQSVSNLAMDLEAEYREYKDRQKAEQEGQNNLPSDPERDLFQGKSLSKHIDRILSTCRRHEGQPILPDGRRSINGVPTVPAMTSRGVPFAQKELEFDPIQRRDRV